MKSCLPPDPHPVQPTQRLPAGACDAHCHVFGPAEIFPYAPDRSYTPPDAPFERLVALHDFLGASRGVIVQASCHGTDNTAMLDAIARGNGRYRGVAIVDGDVTDEQLADLDARGVRGVRFNFVAHLGGAPDLDVFDRVLERIERLGWHVVLHLDAQDILQYAERIARIRRPGMGSKKMARQTARWSTGARGGRRRVRRWVRAAARRDLILLMAAILAAATLLLGASG